MFILSNNLHFFVHIIPLRILLEKKGSDLILTCQFLISTLSLINAGSLIYTSPLSKAASLIYTSTLSNTASLIYTSTLSKAASLINTA